MKISQAGLDLIKSFEGLRLEAYKCPANIDTIGYGSTGFHVKPGLKITEKEAEDLLRKDVVRFEKAVNDLIEVPLNQQQFDALVSFAFNVGINALATSTLRKRLNNKEEPNKVANEELRKWVKGENGPLPGLVKRREAESLLFRSEPKPLETIDVRSAQQTWFKKEPLDSKKLPNEKLAKVYQGRDFRGCKVLERRDGHTLLQLPHGLGTWWVYDKHFEGLGGRIVERRNANVNMDHIGRVMLDVPYQSQRDNYRDADRTCFSSSCAMAAMFLKPGCVANDNEYLKKVFAIGDSTEVSTQLTVLRGLGFNPKFKQNGYIGNIKALLKREIPVPVGILHKGTPLKPTGTGHWICVVGFDDSVDSFYVHDPWGEIDHRAGTYIDTNGKCLEYSYNLFKSRWTVEGPNTGWYIDLSP